MGPSGRRRWRACSEPQGLLVFAVDSDPDAVPSSMSDTDLAKVEREREVCDFVKVRVWSWELLKTALDARNEAPVFIDDLHIELVRPAALIAVELDDHSEAGIHRSGPFRSKQPGDAATNHEQQVLADLRVVT